MVSVNIDAVSKNFGDVCAVDAASLTIERGELFFLLGPSGCGKTTLLRMIAGFYTPSAGRILFDDRDMTDVAPHRRHTGMVFQNYALWPHMTVRENVTFGLEMHGVASDNRIRRADQALDSVQMLDYAARRPNQLSGGQQQRVALARALVIEPDVLLLDEPLSNLDAKLRVEMRAQIADLHRALGLTMIYVTHDQTEALSMADRIAVMDRGRVAQLGTPREVYERPATRFVADFIGETNLIPGTVQSVGDVVVVRTAAGDLRSGVHGGALQEGEPVHCSIRPECLHVADGDDGQVRMVATLERSAYMGNHEQFFLRLADGTEIQAIEVGGGVRPVAAGEALVITVAESDVVVLTDAVA